MQIHYKIPGWEPVWTMPTAAEKAVPVPFRAVLDQKVRAAPSSWRSLLQLDKPATGVVDLGPPARPAGLLEIDSKLEQMQLRRLIEKHAYHAMQGSSGKPPDPDIKQMVSLLLHYQDLEADV